ncbi:MAG: DUF6259 domain-containing protein [Armatimonadota bacterium]|nr:DUF6259 domain-containing protein [Armatimonadota bacterium]
MQRLMVLVLACSLACVAGAQRNLVANPGFEDGLEGWRFWGGGAGGRVLLETEDVHSGTGALRLTNPDAARVRAYQGGVQLNQLQPRPLHLSYWVKRTSDAPDALQCIDLYCTNQDGSRAGYFRNTSVDDVGEWVHMEHTFTPAKPIAQMNVWPLNFDTTADVIFDDIIVTVEPAPSLPAEELAAVRGDSLQLRVLAAKGRVGLRDLRRPGDGRSYLAGEPAIRSDTNLWSAELVSADGRRVLVVPDQRAELIVEAEAGAASIVWRNVHIGEEPALDVQVRVRIAEDQPLAYLTARVQVTADGWGLRRLRMPALAEMPPLGETPRDDAVAWPQGLGRLMKHPEATLAGLHLSYPSSRASMQMLSWHDPDGGLYLAAHDGEGYYKLFDLGLEMTRGLSWSVTHVPEGAGPSCTEYESPWPAVIGVAEGGWYGAAQLYRRWALDQKWCAKGPLAERDLPQTVRETALWMVGCMLRQPAADFPRPELSPDEMRSISAERLREISPGMLPDTNGRRAEAFAGYFDVPVAWWWTTWMLPGFDVRHGAQVAPRGFEETARAVSRAGVPVMPYVNIRRFDTGLAAFDEQMHRGAVVTQEGEVATSPTKGVPAAVMCPASETWQEYFPRYCRSFVERGADGLYVDELGTAGVVPCHADHHNHPAGGGTHWIDGRREIMRRIHELCSEIQPQFFTGGEEPCEPYIDVNEYAFTYGSREPDTIPLWQAVYHDYAVCAGRPVGKWYDPYSERVHYPEELRGGDVRMDEFVTAMGQAVVQGIQPGWVRPDIVSYAPETSRYLRRLAQFYASARPWLLYGRMLPPPRIATELPVVRSRWMYKRRLPVELPAVLGSAWRAPDGAVVLVFANVSEEEHTVELAIEPEQYGLPDNADPGELTIPARDFLLVPLGP